MTNMLNKFLKSEWKFLLGIIALFFVWLNLYLEIQNIKIPSSYYSAISNDLNDDKNTMAIKNSLEQIDNIIQKLPKSSDLDDIKDEISNLKSSIELNQHDYSMQLNNIESDLRYVKSLTSPLR